MLYFLRSLTNPLAQLTDVMKNATSNGLDSAHVDVRTHDEIGVLSRVFNKMMEDLSTSKKNLEEANATLEKKVEERTKALHEMAVRDPLTGLYNRRHFNECLKQNILLAKRHSQNIGIIYTDIDHFKKFNDGNGHPEGDVLLKMFAELLLKSFRQSDLVARLGGEEFCIILPQVDIEGARLAAEKVRKVIESFNFPHGEKQPLGRVTCSFGVSSFPLCGTTEEDLIKAADEALYEIKKTTRNAVAVAKAKSEGAPAA
jgi:diguanylate cyclase (GGDEF)-like protein